MNIDIVIEIAVLVLGAFVGFEVISKVPNTLHTPLMSGTNAIHGIVLVGALIALGAAVGAGDLLSKVILVIAVAFGTINIVGGFLVTDRMLAMFKRKDPNKVAAKAEAEAEGDGAAPQAPAAAGEAGE